MLSRRAVLAHFAASLPAVSEAAEPHADLVVVEKNRRSLQLWRQGKIVKTYRVALGGNPVGPKRQRGDEKTPEGEYVIDSRYRQSDYHWALHISYPNASDRAWARRHRVDPGDAILIHGLPNGQAALGKAHADRDWTLGCIAVTNEEIEEIWARVPNGARVILKP